MANQRDTVVFQSHRRDELPAWLLQSMATVRQWAEANEFAYAFFDDAIFDPLPDWFKEKGRNFKPLLSDLARLLTARRLLDEGYRRAIWVDADVLVFAPDALTIPRESAFYFCREIWITEDSDGILAREVVNNCVCCFEARNPFLDFYIDSCLKIVQRAKNITAAHLVGTFFLTAIDQIVGLPKLSMIGMLSPSVTRDVVRGGGPYLAAYRQCLGGPIYAANLCASYSGASFTTADGSKFVLDDMVFSRLIERLLAAGKSFIAA